MKQFNKIIEFRQDVYDNGLVSTKDAQFDLMDALLHKHACQDANTPFSVILVKTHLERDKPADPF